MKAEEQIEELKEKYQLGKVDLDTLIHRAVSIGFQQREEAERDAFEAAREIELDGAIKGWWFPEKYKSFEDYKSKKG